MRLHVLSDLHLEFSDFPPPIVDTDVVILAGDIGLRSSGVDWASRKFENKKVIYVAGNHEFYGADRTAVIYDLKAKCDESGFYFLDNSSVTLLERATQLPVRFFRRNLMDRFHAIWRQIAKPLYGRWSSLLK